MSQPQALQQQTRGRNGTPSRSSRLASQSNGWALQLGALGSVGAAAAAAAAAAAIPIAEIEAATTAVAAAAAAAAAPFGNGSSISAASLTLQGSPAHASSSGVLSSASPSSPAIGSNSLSSSALALGPDRKLVPTRSGNSRPPAPQQQPSRSLSHPRSAHRTGPGGNGWGPAAAATATAGSGAPSPRVSISSASPAPGSTPANGAIAGTILGGSTAPAGGGSPGGGGETVRGAESGVGSGSGSGSGTAAVVGVAASGGGGSSRARQGPPQSVLRPPSRRGAGTSAGGTGTASSTAATAMATLNAGVVEPYGTAALVGGLGPPHGTQRPHSSLDYSMSLSVAGSSSGGWGMSSSGVGGIPYSRPGADVWGSPLRPNSASVLGPNGVVSSVVGSCPPLPPSCGGYAVGRPASTSARRPLSAQQETAGDGGPRTSRFSLTSISDVAASVSPSLADVALGPGQGLTSISGFASAAGSSQTSSSGAAIAAIGSGPRRAGSALLVSLDGLPPGPSRLYEAITKQLEESDVDVAAAGSGSDSGDEAGNEADVTAGARPFSQPVSGKRRTVPGDSQQPNKHPSQLQPPQQLPLTSQPACCPPAQGLVHSQPQPQQQAISMSRTMGLRLMSDINSQLGPLGTLRASSFHESMCSSPLQHSSSYANAYNPLQPNIRGRLSWTGSAAPVTATAGGCGGGGGACPSSPCSSPQCLQSPLNVSSSSPLMAAAPPSPSYSVSYPAPPPPTPTAIPYRFQALAFTQQQTASLPPQVQAMLQQPFGLGTAPTARDQATAATAVLAAAVGAVVSAAGTGAVTDLRNWLCPQGRASALPDEAPMSPCSGSGTAAAQQGQRLPAGSATAAAAAAAIAGRPYVVNKLRLNLNVNTGLSTSRRQSDTEYYGGTAPSYPFPSSPVTAASTLTDPEKGSAAVSAAAPLPPPAAAANSSGGGGTGAIVGANTGPRGSLLSHLQHQHLSNNQHLLAHLQQQRQVHQQQQMQQQQQQQQLQQQQLFQQQLALQQQQQQRRQQQLQQLQQLQLHKAQPQSKLATLAEALAASPDADLQDYFISASAVGPPLDWEGGGEGQLGTPRRPLVTAWRSNGFEGTSTGDGPSSNRPSTATKSDRAGGRLRGAGGGGALRQQAWLEGSAALVAASSQLNKPQLWIGNGPRPASEAYLWLARIHDAPPSQWESDGWYQRPCSRSYLDGLRTGSGAVEAALEAEELAAARAAVEQQRAAAAAAAGARVSRDGTQQQALGIASRVQTLRATPPVRLWVRSAGPRRRETSSDEEEADDDEEESEEESEEEGKTRYGSGSAAARGRPKPRPPQAPPASRPRPPVPKPRLQALPRGRGRGGVGSNSWVVVDDE